MPTPYKLSGMPLASLFLAVPALTLSIPDLRAQIAKLAFGFLILVIGLAALALFFFRRKTRDLTLLSLGIAAVLYGLRLLPRESIIQSIFHISKPLKNHTSAQGRESESREVDANGLMLGLFPEATYSSVEMQLDAGDRLLLYTDGISEAMNAAREEFGKSRLKQFLAASTTSASRLADALLLELRRWSGTDSGRSQDDDITLLVLEVQ